MATRDPRIASYIQAQAPFARPILRHLRRVLGSSAPGLQETLKWGKPAFLYEGQIVCGMAAFKHHCAAYFWKGMSLIGPKPEKAMGHFGRITTLKDLPADGVLKDYVAKRIEVIAGAGTRR